MNLLENKRVLITGAAGFIGANLLAKLLEHKALVYALVKPTTNLWRINNLLPKINIYKIDFNDRTRLKEILNNIQPEIVFHLASIGGHPNSSEAYLSMLQSNVLGTAYLLDAISSINTKHFIHLGSSLEYGHKNEPLKESDCLKPATFRGVVKASETLLCQQFSQSSSTYVTILRPFSVYGYWEQPTHLIPTAILAALRQKEFLLTPNYYRDPIFIEDVLEALFLCLEKKHASGEIFNIGSSKQWSNEEIVKMVENISQQKINIKISDFHKRPSDTECWVANINKSKEFLGWQPKHTFEDGLRKTVNWFRKNTGLYT